MMNKKIILDTHILLWSLLSDQELSDEIKQTISKAQEEDNLVICSISLLEIAMLSSKKRINIYQPVTEFLKSITDIRGLNVQDISPEIAAESVLLMDDFNGDPADRMIVAATKANSGTLITRDKKILDWARLGHIKFLAG